MSNFNDNMADMFFDGDVINPVEENNMQFKCSVCNMDRPRQLELADKPGVCKYCKNGPIYNAVVVDKDISMIAGKAFNVTLNKDTPQMTRVLYDGKGDYRPEKHFLSHEVSAYVNRKVGKFTWGDVVTDQPEVLLDIVANGYGDYKCIFANWRDRGGKAILVHKASGINGLADMGIFTRIAVINESMKASKYLNRLFAPMDDNHMPVWGKEQEGSWVDATQECVIELENGEELILKYVNLDDMTAEETAGSDGHINLSARAHRALGLTNNPKVGDSFRCTVQTQRKLGKGHTRFSPDQVADIVIYGAKKHVYATEFCFMSLGPLHSGSPRTDIQSVTNFKLYKLAEKLAEKYMRFVHNTAHSSQALINLMTSTLRPSESDEDNDLDVVNVSEKWVMRRSLGAGISPFAFPGMYRRVVRHFTSGVLKAAEFKIPMNADPSISVATSKYMSGDPFAIREDGTPDMTKTVIQDGYICVMDLPDGIDVIIYRQPNENSNAFFKLKNMHHPRFKDSKGKAVAFLGHGVHKIMSRLGGGDMDDNIVIITDPVWVEHFSTLSYPETDKLIAIESGSSELNIDPMDDLSFEEPFDITSFGVRHMEHQIVQASGRDQVGIGPVVNVNMIDSILSDPENREVMFRDLVSQGAGATYTEWFTNRENYTSAFLATNLEIVIDAAVKDPGLLEAMRQEAVKRGSKDLNDFIRNFHSHTLVYPKCMEGRIPARKKDTGDYILAMSDQCKSLARITSMRDQLLQIFARNEWVLVKKADAGISNLLPQADEALKALVHGNRETGRPGVRGWWRNRWAAYQQAIKDNSDAVNDKIYGDICRELDVLLDRYPAEVVEAIALELYRTVYRSENTPAVADPLTGKIRSFHDGLLWTNRFANAFINLLIKNGYSGQIVPVRLLIERHLASKPSVRVVLKEGRVHLLDGDVAVGTIPQVNKTGIYVMKYGMIQFKASDEALHPKANIIELVGRL